MFGLGVSSPSGYSSAYTQSTEKVDKGVVKTWALFPKKKLSGNTLQVLRLDQSAYLY